MKTWFTLGYQKYLHGLGVQEVTSQKSSDNVQSPVTAVHSKSGTYASLHLHGEKGLFSAGGMVHKIRAKVHGKGGIFSTSRLAYVPLLDWTAVTGVQRLAECRKELLSPHCLKNSRMSLPGSPACAVIFDNPGWVEVIIQKHNS